MYSTQVQSIGDKILALPLGRTAKDFLDYLVVEGGFSNNTVLAYGRDLKEFLEYCKSCKIHGLQQINPTLIRNYLQILAQDRISRPSTGSRLLKAPEPCEPFYLRDKAMLELLYATGVRASELAGLKTSDLNLDIGYLRCVGKGNRERVIPIGKAAIAATVEYLTKPDGRAKLVGSESADFLLLSRTGRPMSRIEIWRLVKKYAIRSGMPRNLTVHTLRHCFATHLLSGGADLRSVQEMLGHVDITTTQVYTHVDQDRLRSIHKKFHPRP